MSNTFIIIGLGFLVFQFLLFAFFIFSIVREQRRLTKVKTKEEKRQFEANKKTLDQLTHKEGE